MKKTNSIVKENYHLWHPWTGMSKYQPLVIEEGKGSWLKDTGGKWYIDGASSLWVNVHGHRHAFIDREICGQIRKISHSTLFGLSNIPAIELAEKLVAISPAGLNRVFYSNSGSEACEVALKIAFRYWQQCKRPKKRKTKFIHPNLSYHGDTLGATSVGGIGLFRNLYKPLLFESISAPTPYCYRCPFDKNEKTCAKECLSEVERIIKKNHNEVAALIMEPLIQGAAGMITQPSGYLREVRRLTRKHDILLILDEVAVGFGRTGNMFACEQEGVSPDIMTTSKGLSGGYLPLAATLTTEKIYRAFLGDHRAFLHGHTYTGNPLACRAALASLSVFQKQKTLEKLKAKISLLTRLLLPFNSLEHVGEVRQCGFMVGLELVRDKQTKEAYRWQENIDVKVTLKAREKDIIIRPLGNVIVIMPPLSIKSWELKKLIQGIYESIKEVTA
ncbi:adenosylmethionine--8-amino-7-oxononanoate transaminase [Candidatus Omnitrophota bacterium]